MSRQVQLVILCEDQQQAFFARHYFLERKFHPRKIRIEVSPKGEGAGEQYVRMRYAKEVKAYRRSHVSTSLALVIDADTFTVEERLDQLDTALEEAGLSRRQPDERIGIFVPKRNIETRIYYANGTPVDEETVYPKLARERDSKPAVERFVEEICRADLPEDAPSSLRIACDELVRLLF